MKKHEEDPIHCLPWIIAVSVLLGFCAVIYLGTFVAEMSIEKSADFEMKSMKMSSSLRGEFSLSEVNHQVYKKLGYEIIDPALPMPVVSMKKEPSCELVFRDREVTGDLNENRETLSEILKRKFTLNGYSRLSQETNERIPPVDQHQNPKNSWKDFINLMTLKLTELAELEYKKDGMSVHHAMQAYSLTGKRGIIYGSRTPWLEVFALQHGAEHLVTVEEHQIDVPAEFQDRIEHVYPDVLAENWEKFADTFDFAVSFSKIQSVGLGASQKSDSDPDPTADFREMLKFKCLLKRGGLLFLGVPLGDDEIIFNKSRIYGPVRLPMLLHGFELIAGFNGDNPSQIDLGEKSQLFSNSQNTLVLRKL